MRVVPSAQGGGDGQDRIFVDHRRRALGRHLDALQRAAATREIGDRLAALLARVLEGDVGAHLAQASR